MKKLVVWLVLCLGILTAEAVVKSTFPVVSAEVTVSQLNNSNGPLVASTLWNKYSKTPFGVIGICFLTVVMWHKEFVQIYKEVK